MMAFAFKAAESAEDRNLSILLADKDLEIARRQLDDAESDSMMYSLASIFFG